MPEAASTPHDGLESRYVDVTERRARIMAALADARSARSDSTDDDEHDPEGPTMSSTWAQLDGIRRDLDDQVAGLERARERVATGVYGRCERCGNAIASGRLEARPDAELCIDCARLAR